MPPQGKTEHTGPLELQEFRKEKQKQKTKNLPVAIFKWERRSKSELDWEVTDGDGELHYSAGTLLSLPLS